MKLTHCWLCKRKLTDVTSKSIGMGPTCRKLLQIKMYTPDDYKRALGALAISGLASDLIKDILHAALPASRMGTILIRWASKHYQNDTVVLSVAFVMGYLGYTELEGKARALRLPFEPVYVNKGGYFRLQTPYNPDFVIAVRPIKGRRYDGDKWNSFRHEAFDEVAALVWAFYKCRLEIPQKTLSSGVGGVGRV